MKAEPSPLPPTGMCTYCEGKPRHRSQVAIKPASIQAWVTPHNEEIKTDEPATPPDPEKQNVWLL